MKELSIEEKAKRYDEAFELVNSKWHYKNQPCVIDVSEIFPELKENEDEQSKKWILEYLYDGCRKSDEQFKGQFKAAIAWLEKQGEQKPQGKSALEAIKEEKVDNQNCAKPADKVEPKFKQGEWITNNDYTWQIVNVTDLDYILQSQNGHIVYDTISHVDEQFHTFAIQDAKDGDVLVSESNCGLGTWYCIFKSLDDDESMTVYCYLTRDGRFETKKELCFDKSPFNTKPATKEQRDALEKAMADAGYTFDFKKNELKKVEPTDKYKGLTDFERTLADICIGWIGEELGWKQYIKDNADVLLKIAAKKFNSVQDVPFEQKPDWSEEDKNFMYDTLSNLTELKDRFGKGYGNVGKCIKWLESLKDRYTWKPSDEQMTTLRLVISGCSYDIEPLVEMEEQLKKLRGE